jgi:hypothetical protein
LVKTILTYLLFLCSIPVLALETKHLNDSIHVEFIGKQYNFETKNIIERYKGFLSKENISEFMKVIETNNLAAINSSLIQIRKDEKLDDWIFYQLIRKTSQALIKKSDDYIAYTICKWYFLKESGYDPLLCISKEKILLYVRSEDIIYNQPIKALNNQQYVCLNYHDYKYAVDFENEKFINIDDPKSSGNEFSFKINSLPRFDKSNYLNKEIVFQYKQHEDKLNIKVNPTLIPYFNNYPVMDYENQFNIPLSKETYESIIPALKEKTKKFSVNKGVEYLMYFTRHAFLYEKDTEIFGREKRFSPEETLLNEKSDCEDRSALFYLLVKEIYNLPMIVITLPDHVTVAVKLNQVNRNAVIYKGASFTICEPTPQKKELKMGQTIANLTKGSYDVVYFYEPTLK